MRCFILTALAVFFAAFFAGSAEAGFKSDATFSLYNTTIGAQNVLITITLYPDEALTVPTGSSVSFTLPHFFREPNVLDPDAEDALPRACNASSLGLNPALAKLTGTTARVDAAAEDGDRTTTFTVDSGSVSFSAANVTAGAVLRVFCVVNLPETEINGNTTTIVTKYGPGAALSSTSTANLPFISDALAPVVRVMHTFSVASTGPATAAARALASAAYLQYTTAQTAVIFHQLPEPMNSPVTTSVTLSFQLAPAPFVTAASVAASINNVANNTIKNNMALFKERLQTIFAVAELIEFGTATEDFQPGTCFDKYTNAGETDLNCGGGNCRACPRRGMTCNENSDCASYTCIDGMCFGVNAAALSASATLAVVLAVAVAAMLGLAL